MSEVKVAFIGAGSFVFGPSVLAQALLENRTANLHLALVDIDDQVVQLMGGVGLQMARRTGVNARITAHTAREDALDGADFVICSAAPQLHRRFQIDRDIIRRRMPKQTVTEFGGPAGIGYSLRQIAFIEQVVADMKRLCPGAWLLNSANPLPRVCQAAHELGVRTAGFCSAAIEGYDMLWRILHGRGLEYPYAEARDNLSVTMAGTNHFCFAVEVFDRRSGKDLLGLVREKLARGATSGNPRGEQLSRETGYLAIPNDHHVGDFIHPTADSPSREHSSHGDAKQRERRLVLMRDVAERGERMEELLSHPSWERPMDLVASMTDGRKVEFNTLNLVNAGQIPNLPHGVFVETPVTADAAGAHPKTIKLPESVEPHCRLATEVTDTIVKAGLSGRRELAHKALELDPTVVDKKAGAETLDEILAAHADVLPRFAR
jgi:alpha-galactosidase